MAADATPVQPDGSICYLALGSNIGDRLRFLTSAMRRLAHFEGVQIKRTSALYSTAAQYVADQPSFLNAVVEVQLSVERRNNLPGLMADLKVVEDDLGRKPGGVRRGPRVIDLDIIAVGESQFSSKEGPYPLEIPHAQMHERDFVLAPMADLCPQWRHPARNGHPTVSAMLAALSHGATPEGASLDAPPVQVIPAAGGIHGRTDGLCWQRGARTLVMGILNVTPDSFSDGGDHLVLDDAIAGAKSMLEAGADILDIGGESTRPGAEEVAVEKEIGRVVPVIRAIRERLGSVTISVDTRKAAVARAAVEAGADWINDVSGGEFDAEMLATAAELMAPIVLMHSRGTPQTMTSLTKYHDVVIEVGEWLAGRRSQAEAAGVLAWNVVLDPGVGFAKTFEHNLALLRSCGSLVERLSPSPMLVGASRKRFLGSILDEPDAKKRVFGNAACVAASVSGNCDIVRVHEVREMSQTAKVCDCIYRAQHDCKAK